MQLAQIGSSIRSDLPCDLSFAASLVGHCHQRGLGLTGLVHEDAHPTVSNPC